PTLLNLSHTGDLSKWLLSVGLLFENHELVLSVVSVLFGLDGFRHLRIPSCPTLLKYLVSVSSLIGDRRIKLIKTIKDIMMMAVATVMTEIDITGCFRIKSILLI